MHHSVIYVNQVGVDEIRDYSLFYNLGGDTNVDYSSSDSDDDSSPQQNSLSHTPNQSSSTSSTNKKKSSSNASTALGFATGVAAASYAVYKHSKRKRKSKGVSTRKSKGSTHKRQRHKWVKTRGKSTKRLSDSKKSTATGKSKTAHKGKVK